MDREGGVGGEGEGERERRGKEERDRRIPSTAHRRFMDLSCKTQNRSKAGTTYVYMSHHPVHVTSSYVHVTSF